MGFSCVFTFIFYVIPLCFKLIVYDNDDDPTTHYSELMRVTVAVSCNLNPLTNVAAILIKQDDIANRVRQLFPECTQKSIYKCDQIKVIRVKSTLNGLKKNLTIRHTENKTNTHSSSS